MPHPAPISYAYNPAAYPLVAGYYPPPAPPTNAIPYSYYESTPAAGAGQGQIKKQNIALYNFMAQHPAPTEREQATLVRRWAKETRPDRGRQSWVAHAFATSFKNWVKEYEAGNINANPADFGTSADADGEADPDPEHDPDHEQFTSSQFVGAEQSQPQSQSQPTQQSTGTSFGGDGSFGGTPPMNGPAPPPQFSQFNVPQEAAAGVVNAGPEEESKTEGTSTENTNGEASANGNPNTSNAAGFPPMYPQVLYPPVENEQQKEGA
ncbi:hypothetical protein FRC09_011971 [Ceratobasidium sp. 395]|nr:hypothetical protein FRC09_011971 [Ceratobasidium sp. 395]